MIRKTISWALWLSVVGSVTFFMWAAVEAVNLAQERDPTEGMMVGWADTVASHSELELRPGQTTSASRLTAAFGVPGRVEWSSSDTSIVQVDSLGRVTGRNPGQAVITANFADEVAHTIVRVRRGMDADTGGSTEGADAERDPSGPNVTGRASDAVTRQEVEEMIDERIEREHELGWKDIFLVVLDKLLAGLGFLVYAGLFLWIANQERWDVPDLLKP